MPPGAHRHRPLLGGTLVLVATGLFSIQDAVIKVLGGEFSLFQILFLRSLVGSTVMAIALGVRFGRSGMRTSRPLDHALRALFNVLAFLCYYHAVTSMPLASATALVLTAPLFKCVLSGPVAGEPASRPALIACGVGFLGVLAIIRPTSGAGIDAASLLMPSLSALAGAVFFALLGLQNRRMSTTESSELMVFWGSVAFVVVGGVALPGTWHDPGTTHLALMLGLGVVATAAQYLIVHGVRYAPVFLIAPVEYSGLLWAGLLGFLMFSERPDPLAAAGAALIATSGIYVITRPLTPPGKVPVPPT